MAGPICVKFSGKVWSDHGTTWLHFWPIPRSCAMLNSGMGFVVLLHHSLLLLILVHEYNCRLTWCRLDACEFCGSLNVVWQIIFVCVSITSLWHSWQSLLCRFCLPIFFYTATMCEPMPSPYYTSAQRTCSLIWCIPVKFLSCLFMPACEHLEY